MLHLGSVRRLHIQTRPRGYTTFFMINSNEHEISTAHKNLSTENEEVYCFRPLRCCLFVCLI